MCDLSRREKYYHESMQMKNGDYPPRKTKNEGTNGIRPTHHQKEKQKGKMLNEITVCRQRGRGRMEARTM